MIDYHGSLVSALKTILPTHYELVLTSGTKTPCISYMELDNADTTTGDTLGYSTITYQIKIWGNSIATLQKYAKEIDKKLRPLGFKRIAVRELVDGNSTMVQKIMTYKAEALENY